MKSRLILVLVFFFFFYRCWIKSHFENSPFVHFFYLEFIIFKDDCFFSFRKISFDFQEKSGEGFGFFYKIFEFILSDSRNFKKVFQWRFPSKM